MYCKVCPTGGGFAVGNEDFAQGNDTCRSTLYFILDLFNTRLTTTELASNLEALD